MFVPAYSASQSFVFFVLRCGIRVASMPSVDSIPFLNGVLILRCEYKSFMIIEIVMSILFNRCASLQVDPIISTFVRSILSFLNGIRFICPQVAFVFLPSHPFLLQGLIYLNQVSILWMWSFFIPFFQCSYLVILMKMLKEASSLSFFALFSSPVDSIQALSIISFPHFKCFLMPVHLLIIHLLLFMVIWSAEDIPKIRVFHSTFVQAISRSYLIQAIYSNLCNISFKSFNGVFFWVGPNPQVFSQDLTWLFYFPRAILNSSPSLT